MADEFKGYRIRHDTNNEGRSKRYTEVQMKKKIKEYMTNAGIDAAIPVYARLSANEERLKCQKELHEDCQVQIWFWHRRFHALSVLFEGLNDRLKRTCNFINTQLEAMDTCADGLVRNSASTQSSEFETVDTELIGENQSFRDFGREYPENTLPKNEAVRADELYYTLESQSFIGIGEVQTKKLLRTSDEYLARYYRDYSNTMVVEATLIMSLYDKASNKLVFKAKKTTAQFRPDVMTDSRSDVIGIITDIGYKSLTVAYRSYSPLRVGRLRPQAVLRFWQKNRRNAAVL